MPNLLFKLFHVQIHVALILRMENLNGSFHLYMTMPSSNVQREKNVGLSIVSHFPHVWFNQSGHMMRPQIHHMVSWKLLWSLYIWASYFHKLSHYFSARNELNYIFFMLCKHAKVYYAKDYVTDASTTHKPQQILYTCG